jgi:hypothetical protein
MAYSVEKYQKLRNDGTTPEDAYRAARADELDEIESLKMLRDVYELSITEAKTVSTNVETGATSLEEFQQNLMESLNNLLKVDDDEELSDEEAELRSMGVIPLTDDLMKWLGDAVRLSMAERDKNDFYAPEQEEMERERLKQQGILIDEIGGACPLQAEGFIDGHPFYFRARGDRWQIGLAAQGGTQDDAVQATIMRDLPPGYWYYEEDYGEPNGFAAGWMPVREGLEFIEQAAQRFRAGDE